jgi:hypothetical protein
VTTGNSAGANSPLYYAIVGLPSLFLSGDVAVYSMRAVSGLLCAAALALMVMQLTMLARFRWAIIGVTVALTPMVFFLAGSINPNALEAASAGALFATLVAAFRAPSTTQELWERVVIAAFAVAVLANTRSIGLLWVLIALGAAFGLANFPTVRKILRTPAAWALIAVTGITSLVAVLWYANPPDTAPQEFNGTGTGALAAFVAMLVRTFDFASGLTGNFGWVDTAAPPFSAMVCSASVLAILVAAFVWGSGRTRWVVVGLAAALVLIPAVTQAVLAPQFGFIWQGRYMLAVFVCLIVACGIALDDADVPLIAGSSRAAVAILVGLLAVGQVWSFAWTLRRYVTGSDGAIGDLFDNPSWQPPLGWITLTALMAIAAAFAASAAYRLVFRTEWQWRGARLR